MTKKFDKILPNPNRKSGDIVIYGLTPSDLPSLREPNGTGSQGGKIAAHGHHAGVQLLKYAHTPDVKEYIKDGMAGGADYFNTCITLDASTKQVDSIIDMAKGLGYIADKVIDPSYPWFVDIETAKYLNDDCTIIWDVVKDGKVLALRKVTTFGWLLGDKGNDPIFRALVGALRLAK